MNLRQAKLTIFAKLLGYKVGKTYEGYHYIYNPNRRKKFQIIYLEDL